MENIGVYIRKSRETENSKSLQEQHLLGGEFCKKNNYNPIYYSDGVVSGAGDSSTKRPQFQKLKEDISSGKLYGVYIWATDRLAREESEWQDFAKLLKVNNVLLFDNGVLTDFSSDNTYLFYSLKSAMDAHFARVTSSKIKTVLNRNAKAGKFGGILKYGYKRGVNGTTIINEEEAEVIKEIFHLSLNGKGYKAIAEHLNDTNIPTRYNKIGGNYIINENLHGKESKIINKNKKDAKWTSRVIQTILNSRNYIGEKEYQGEIIKIPSIISLKIYNKVQDRIASRRNKAGKRTYNKFLLNNLILCDKCGKRYTGRKINKYNYYRCASRIIKGGSCGNKGIQATLLDEEITTHFFKEKLILFLSKEYFKNSNKDKESKQINTEKEIKELEKQLIAKEKQLTNVTKYLIEEVLTPAEGKKQINRIRKEIEDINLQIELKKETLNNISINDNQLKEIKKDFNKNILSFEEKKLLLEKYIREIRINDRNKNQTIEIEFILPIPNYLLEVKNKTIQYKETLLQLRDMNDNVIYKQKPRGNNNIN